MEIKQGHVLYKFASGASGAAVHNSSRTARPNNQFGFIVDALFVQLQKSRSRPAKVSFVAQSHTPPIVVMITRRTCRIPQKACCE